MKSPLVACCGVREKTVDCGQLWTIFPHARQNNVSPLTRHRQQTNRIMLKG